jgi:hypothetical protein
MEKINTLKRKAPEELSQNPRTIKERKRQEARNDERAKYERAKKADVEAERRKLNTLKKTVAFQNASSDVRQNLATQARDEVRRAR